MLNDREKKEALNITIGRLRERLRYIDNQRAVELFEKIVKEISDLEIKALNSK